ncbi:hypothetical protein TSAR_011346 [Trichomalopsis sarcophagae]|uniref:EGF-like domain-containing protein n=1 Tax=Trichomalopsis sarcophagae TaxID=543379 RepID=A0A232ENV6_9HYME|nr:hypothetical protein TSAR_011346 [Trichomalopsis sarcophagae]
MAVSRTTCVVSTLVTCLLVGAGTGLAVWLLKPSNNESGSTTESSVTTTEPTRPSWPVEFDAGLIVRTINDVQAHSFGSENSIQLLSKSVAYVDFYKNKTLYYAAFGGTEPIRATSGGYPSLKYPGEFWYVTALAVDFITEKLYVYDDQASKIELYDLQGKYMGIVLSELYYVKDILLDFWKGRLLILQSSKILSAGMDGVDLREIVQDTNIEAFALDFHHTLLYYSKSNVIMAHDYFSTHKTYEVAKIDAASSVFGLAVTRSSLYYLSRNKEKSVIELNSCELGSPTPTGKCLNPRNWNLPQDSRQLKAFDMFDLQLTNNPCQQMNGGCEQLCVRSDPFSTDKAISCQCQIGWQLNSDTKTCLPVEVYLMYVRGYYLKGRILDLDKKSFIDVIEPMRLMLNSLHPVPFDFNARKGYAVYADVSDLWRLNLRLADGEQRLNLLEENFEFHMLYPTIDWLNDQLYYLRRRVNGDSPSYLMVRRTDYSEGFEGQKVIYEIPENRQPRAMALSLNLGLIYFTVLEASNDAAIYRINTDGTRLVPFVVEENGFSVSEFGLAFDSEARNLYWFNADRTQVQFATWSATLLRTIDISRLKNPLTISIHREWMYISSVNSVWRFHKETGEYAQNVFDQAGEESERDYSMIKPFGESVQPIDYNHPCASRKGGCQGYCFGVPTGEEGKLQRVCGCDENQELQEDKTSCKNKKSV